MKPLEDAMQPVLADFYPFPFRTPSKKIIQTEPVEQLTQRKQFSKLLFYYQPIFHGLSNDIVKLEALVRYQQDDGTVLPPCDFLGQFLQASHLANFNCATLEKVLSDLILWQQPYKVAINFSPEQLLEKHFVSLFKGLDSMLISQLEIEVTEQDTHKLDELACVLEKLRLLGLSIVLDDIIPDEACAKRITSLPIDGIKLDKALLKRFGPKYSDWNIQRAYVENAICECQEAGLSVTAEGVLTERQRHYLYARGCTYFQGFSLARPVKPDRVISC